MLETSSAFTPTELQIVLLATSFENDCAYCMAAHTAIAGLRRVPQGVIESLRDGTAISDPKLEALRRKRPNPSWFLMPRWRSGFGTTC